MWKGSSCIYTLFEKSVAKTLRRFFEKSVAKTQGFSKKRSKNFTALF
jgi:hypothetical protein